MIRPIKLKNKSAQAELITTVLLILISIVAVVLVASFIINMVKQNLQSTDCFQTSTQLSINLDEKYTYYDAATSKVYVSIKRGEKDFNMTGISISVGTEANADPFIVKLSGGASEVTMLDGGNISLPGISGTRTYIIDVSDRSLGNVSKVKIAPMIASNKICQEGVDEQNIPIK